MGPLITQGIINPEWNPIFAFLIGLGFGYALEQGGFSSSRKLVGVFYGYDMITLRVFLTAVLTASIGLLYFNYVGWIDLSMIYINPTFLWSAIVGGAIMGLGFILGGFCPGTAFCAFSIGKLDALLFIGGLVIGILVFTEGFPLWKDLFYAENMGTPTMDKFFGIPQGLFALLMILVAFGMFYVGDWAEKKFPRDEY